MAAEALPARLGRYEIVCELARGGMAELYLARLPGVEGFTKQVAVKRVRPELARERELVELFVAEARLAATLDHQNIVHVHDIGHDDAGYFFAMELLHGADLGTILATVTRFGGRLPIAIAIEIARSAAAGLHYAHERRSQGGEPLDLVHRDVSPQNVFVTFDGAIKLLDFGIAKAAQAMPAHTRSGALRGKVPYMSPEQCASEHLDRRSDVFSLGIVLWEMTVGERLYGDAGEAELATLQAIVERDAPRPSSRRADYPPELERIVMTALARDRAQRFPTAEALQIELEQLARAKSWWVSAREIAAFMAEAFPERARSWQDAARRGTSPALARVTVELPADAPGPTTAVPGSPMPAPAAARRAGRAGLAIGAIALAAIALAIGFAWGRAGRTASHPPASPTTPTGSGALPSEDAQWFQPDDVLASKQPYAGERLDTLFVAKMLAPPAQPGGRTRLLDGAGRELDTEYYWKTRIARRDDLTIGQLAFCQAPAYLDKASAPKTRAIARTEPWMMGRISNVAQLDSGQVSVANVVCDLAGVRVIAR